MDGMSPLSIADKLNDLGILSPVEYKKSIGSKHKGFKTNGNSSKWTAQAVKRILHDQSNMGTLVQGRKTTISHKVKKVVERNKSDWTVAEDFIPAIVSKEVFDVVQTILSRDTRKVTRNAEENVFSGMLFCADCKDTMVRQITKYKDKTTVFYRCSTQKNLGGCFNHNIREDVINQAVLSTVNAHIQAVIGLEKAVSMIDKTDLNRNNRGKVERLIKEKEAEISKRKKDIFFTHQSFADGIITEDEFKEFKAIYDMQISDAEKSIERLKEEQKSFADDVESLCAWMKDFKSFGTIKELNHKILVLLIDRIYVGGDKTITVYFRYRNEFESLSKIVETVNNQNRLMICAG